VEWQSHGKWTCILFPAEVRIPKRMNCFKHLEQIIMVKHCIVCMPTMKRKLMKVVSITKKCEVHEEICIRANNQLQTVVRVPRSPSNQKSNVNSLEVLQFQLNTWTRTCMLLLEYTAAHRIGNVAMKGYGMKLSQQHAHWRSCKPIRKQSCVHPLVAGFCTVLWGLS
jgi:hypothetical protein